MSPPLSDEQSSRVERHAALVAKIARRVARRVRVLGVDELESVGNEALVQCAMRYDPSQAASFSTYAHYRIHGAMIDAVRKLTPGRRTHKRALVRLEATQALLGQAAEDHSARTRAGQRETLEQRVEAARELVRRAAIAVMLSEPDGAVDQAPTDQPNPEQLLLDADARTRMWGLIDALDPAQRELIAAIYERGQSMTEIAGELGVSLATVSRRHARAIELLAKRARAQERG